jgi:hypothetical protein
MFDPGRIDEARAVCEDCPVVDQCLHDALDAEPTLGVWAGMTFDERTLLCPVCHNPKPPEALACDFPHRLLRLARMAEQQELGDPDVAISLRQRPSARTNPECIVARGRSHDTAAAYRLGCRCRAALDAKMAEHYDRGTHKPGSRGPYRPRTPKQEAS